MTLFEKHKPSVVNQKSQPGAQPLGLS
jgi:hypothetical protein